jgi:predicted secreted protein
VAQGRWWKLLGLAGIAGVAATGAVVVRDQRRRANLTPDEVRDRLQRRLAESDSDTSSG